MKILNTLLIFFIFAIQSTAWSQNNNAIDQLLSMRKEASRQSEANAEDIQRLQGELNRLGQRLAETNQRLSTVQAQNLPAQLVTSVGLEEIVRYLDKKSFGSCRVTAGEHIGEYFIQRDNVKIRFVFLAKDDTLGPKASLIRGEQGEDVLQILQPGYDTESIDKAGPITATVRFLMSAGEVGQVIHAVFVGQRVEDRMFGYKSSYSITNITCVL